MSTEAWFTKQIIFVLAAFHDLFRFNETIPYPRNIIKEPIGIIILPLGGIGERRGGNNIVRSMERGGYTTRIIPQLGSTFFIPSTLFFFSRFCVRETLIQSRLANLSFTIHMYRTTYTGTQQQQRRLFFPFDLVTPYSGQKQGFPTKNKYFYLLFKKIVSPTCDVLAN